ncbi:bifunctional diguanylate cyclase/phosphodiesterase [Halomonas campisalis]|uniref:Bifunctional diguanylate cyclase/phosphodiesterase n=1 Tax=Billgrantia campisalis TaxID=74661 RepID=A0ABS9P9I7_9GAMM|nr:bifunctional diguanylate cyclase/phosphodiesterase [Halomonas campisalis]MCG6658423.1 bifunctional diguanylate cyclase/phosphodiesterase [Halomonas campisalis]MDR5863094.1 bifunctional diguanylate cyclase/phosphodiesterase [Halomonas campisalis]
MAKTLLAYLRTLKGFVLVAILSVSLAVFFSVTLVATLLYEDIIARQAEEASETLAEQSYSAMLHVMRQGWSREEMEAFMAGMKRAHADSAYRFELYRGERVVERFGEVDQPAPDAAIGAAFASGETRVLREDGQLRRVMPLVAGPDCLSCHQNVASGDVLGVIDIRHDMSPISAEMRGNYVALFIVASMMLLLLALAISTVFSNRIRESMDGFRARLAAVNSVEDFRQLDVNDVDVHFQELNEAFLNVNALAGRLKNVAVDKDILEFEIRLLSKFIITSDVVRDWREFIKELLGEINTIITAHTLVTIFQVEEEGYELEVFWHRDVSPQTRETFESLLTQMLEAKHSGQTDVRVLKVAHHAVYPYVPGSEVAPELAAEDIRLQTKSLLLEAPKIGGIVGIGVQSDLAQDPLRHIVIDGILSTLLNLVGSVKAIYKYTQDLEFYATRDPLTSLHNQRMFKDLLGYEVGRAQRHGDSFSLLMMDLDNFKTVNDRYGHAFGDQFLQAFAETLCESVRPGDFLARYGGDEFSIILPETGEGQAYSVAQRIAHNLSRQTLVAPDGSTVRATTSIGIAAYPRHAGDAHDLFLMADNMMYKAKRKGKNCVALPDDDEVAAIFRQVGEKNQMVLSALEERRIVPYFQPIADARTGEVHIHELLMRIQVDDRIVAAGDFIDIAESIGVIHKMDYQLIEKAFAQVSEQGYDGMLFINLSPKSLIIGEFIGRIHQLAIDYGIRPERIVFELTERETVSNLKLLEKFVLDLKLEGFNFAIDDFGSGFSSFRYLKQFPIDVIKIEGEFIRNMLSDDKYMAFVKSIVTLAQSLEISTIAEFIEDEAVLEKVRELGIDFGQGYHLGRPGPQFVIEPRRTEGGELALASGRESTRG